MLYNYSPKVLFFEQNSSSHAILLEELGRIKSRQTVMEEITCFVLANIVYRSIVVKYFEFA